MKKFLMALAATTMVVSPLAVSQAQAAPHREVTRVVKQGPHGRTVVKQRTVVRNNGNAYRNNNYRANNHRWAKGQRFDRRQATNYRVINNYRGYRLNAPPRGYHWVQSGNDAVLIAITSGIIGAVIGGAIR
ncbi:RcnB family protein [Sphingobium aromaticiconvertens]|uniref:RcnB family protein n=1 Tax=Sphingobium aromaticiconvertens TaxID=365341 RepID=UPI00301616DF